MVLGLPKGKHSRGRRFSEVLRCRRSAVWHAGHEAAASPYQLLAPFAEWWREQALARQWADARLLDIVVLQSIWPNKGIVTIRQIRAVLICAAAYVDITDARDSFCVQKLEQWLHHAVLRSLLSGPVCW